MSHDELKKTTSVNADGDSDAEIDSTISNAAKIRSEIRDVVNSNVEKLRKVGSDIANLLRRATNRDLNDSYGGAAYCNWNRFHEYEKADRVLQYIIFDAEAIYNGISNSLASVGRRFSPITNSASINPDVAFDEFETDYLWVKTLASSSPLGNSTTINGISGVQANLAMCEVKLRFFVREIAMFADKCRELDSCYQREYVGVCESICKMRVYRALRIDEELLFSKAFTDEDAAFVSADAEARSTFQDHILRGSSVQSQIISTTKNKTVAYFFAYLHYRSGRGRRLRRVATIDLDMRTGGEMQTVFDADSPDVYDRLDDIAARRFSSKFEEVLVCGRPIFYSEVKSVDALPYLVEKLICNLMDRPRLNYDEFERMVALLRVW